MIVLALFALIVVFSIGFLVGAKQEQIRQSKFNIVETIDTNTKKVPPCIGHELESQKENEKLDIDFMNKWIRQKSGK